MINKIMNKFKVAKKDEFDIEINAEEILVLRDAVTVISVETLQEIAKESNVTKIEQLINQYNETNNLLVVIEEEIKNKFEEITVNEIQLSVILNALEILETTTTNNLKLVEDPKNYKTLCKTMVNVTNLHEKVMNLI